MRKPHYAVLDGLRGIAAIAVVIFHFMEIIITQPELNFIGHGFLAVDFFYCLSGFVIAYSYDDRMGNLSLKSFFKMRLIRLHPLVILGSVLGLITFLIDPFISPFSIYSWPKIIGLFIASILLIPMPTMADRFFNLFGLNAPAWSLFWEYIANIFYALILWKLSKKILSGIVILFAIGIVYVVYHSGNIMGGWGGETFWDGGIRLGFSFTIGMLIKRFNWKISNNLNFAFIAILLFVLFLVPFGKWNIITEPLIIMVIFPLIILLGIGTKSAFNNNKVIHFLGEISYPLYMTHYSFMWLFNHYLLNYKPTYITVAFIIIFSIPVLVFFAFLSMKYVDKPIRKYLQSKS